MPGTARHVCLWTTGNPPDSLHGSPKATLQRNRQITGRIFIDFEPSVTGDHTASVARS